MLTNERFEQIKKQIGEWTAAWVNIKWHEVDADEVLSALTHLRDEIIRVRSTPQVGGRSHVKPVIFDAQGKPTAPPPLAQLFAHERREQFALDRHEAMMSLDPMQWRTFALRWGLSPPPGGWENTQAIVNMMHRTRLEIDSIPYLAKHLSATHCIANGIALPQGMRIENGMLYGTKSAE